MDTEHYPFEGPEDKGFPWFPSVTEQTSSRYTNFTLLSQKKLPYFPAQTLSKFC